MRRDEFKRRLGQLESSIYRGLLYYSVWEGLWPTEGTIRAMNRYRDFLGPVRSALFEMMLIHFTEVLDGEDNPGSLSALLRVAREEEETLAPWARDREINDMWEQLAQDERTLESLKQMKDRHLAYFDARPLEDATVRKGEVDNFIKGIQTVFNRLFFAHDGSRHVWSVQVQRASWTTAEILRVLGGGAARRRGPGA
jgi:hypothetical protein